MNRSLSELCSFIFRETYPLGSSDEYIEHEPELLSAIRSLKGIKTDLSLRAEDPVAERVAASVILSDFTSLYLDSKVKVILQHGELKGWPDAVMRSVEPDKLGVNLDVHCEYFFGLPGERLLADIEPLIDAGRILLRPQPQLVVQTESGQTRRYSAEPNTPDSLWLPKSGHSSQDGIPLKDEDSGGSMEEKRFSILLPYITGISWTDLSRVLDDEGDILAEFRSHVNEVVAKATDEPNNTVDIVNDVVRPSVDRVARRFRTLTGMHALKTAGAAVSTCALTLVALTDAGVASSLAKVMGPAGLGLVAKEIADFVKAKAEVREMPCYLLWRIGRKNRTA